MAVDGAEKTHRVVIGGFPQFRVEKSKRSVSVAVPCPPQVVSQVGQAAQTPREVEAVWGRGTRQIIDGHNDGLSLVLFRLGVQD